MLWGNKPVQYHLYDAMAVEKFASYTKSLDAILAKALPQHGRSFPTCVTLNFRHGERTYTLWLNNFRHPSMASAIIAYTLAEQLPGGEYYHLLFLERVTTSTEIGVADGVWDEASLGIKTFYVVHDNMALSPDPAYSIETVGSALGSVGELEVSGVYCRDINE